MMTGISEQARAEQFGPHHTPRSLAGAAVEDRAELIAEARALVRSWDQRGSWVADSPVGMVDRLANALETASLNPEPSSDVREAIADEISGIQVGAGYYATTIGIDVTPAWWDRQFQALVARQIPRDAAAHREHDIEEVRTYAGTVLLRTCITCGASIDEYAPEPGG